MHPSHLIALGAASLASAQLGLTTITGADTSTCTETTTSVIISPWTSVSSLPETSSSISLSSYSYSWTSSSLPPISTYPSSLTTVNWTASYTDTVGAPTVTSYDGGSPTNSSATSPATVTSGNAAPNVDGLTGDSSMLGLVVFFALSFCLL